MAVTMGCRPCAFGSLGPTIYAAPYPDGGVSLGWRCGSATEDSRAVLVPTVLNAIFTGKGDGQLFVTRDTFNHISSGMS